MTNEELTLILGLPHELSGIEFKGPGRLDDRRLMAQVIKAILGIANRRDGGRVIIWVADNRGTPNPVGLSADDLSTWTYDALGDQVANYADPSVAFELEVKERGDHRFVVLEIAEFTDIPVLCKKAFDDVLRDGACYVRTRRKPETSEIPTQAEMRDLLDLAVEKGLRQYLERAGRLGLFTPATLDVPVADQERFESQRGALDE